MLWVQEVDAFVHALPVTKAQLDLAHARCPGVLGENGARPASKLDRDVPLASVGGDNYWGLFARGVTPQRAADFARCCGPAFRVPSAGEWKTVYALLLRHPFDHVDGTLAAVSRQRAQGLLQRLDPVARGLATRQLGEAPSLADRLFFRLGVMEWVRLDPAHEPLDAQDFGGLGLPARALWPSLFDPLLDAPVCVPARGTDKARQHAYGAFGFRLFRARAEEAAWSPQ
jgi:hypothetical protein